MVDTTVLMRNETRALVEHILVPLVPRSYGCASLRIGINCRLTNALCIVNPRDTETVVSSCTGGQVSGYGQ